MKARRPLLYIAAPYTQPDPVFNAHAVCKVGTIVFEQTEWAPVVPHTTLLWHAVTPRPIEFWYELDLAVLARCDAIVRLPGASKGADNEVAAAVDAGIQVIPFKALPGDAIDAWLTPIGQR